jgi:sugar/nucleoside kinase (ribokinase family)
MKQYHVSSVCNALMDILVMAQDKDLAELGLTKGVMHLVDSERQKVVLDYFSSQEATVELGGSAMNCIRSLAGLGKKAVFAGVICRHDSYGKKIEEKMRGLGIKAHLGHAEEATGTCLILVTPDGQRTMNTCLGASRLYNKSVVPHDDIAQSRIFHFSGYQWDTEDQKEAILSAIHTAKQNHVLVSFDVADPFVVTRHRNDFINLIKEYADVVFANEEETRLLFESTPEKAADFIVGCDALAVVKLGAKGALLQSGEKRVHVAPVKTDVVDTTAAGDMFASGILYGLLKEKKLEDIGKAGAILAADVISRMGAKVSEGAFERVKSL